MFIEIEFKALNVIDGIMLNWTLPKISNKTIVGYKLLRKRYEYPTTITDGNLLLTSDETVLEYHDVGVKNSELYYYTLFIIDSDGLVYKSTSTQVYIIAKLIGDSGDRLYNQLPEIYRSEDSKLYNITSEFYQPLRRFLNVFGYQIDSIETLIEKIVDMLDIDTCDVNMLKGYADFFGILYNNSIPINDNRKVINVVLETIGSKGTKQTLEYLLQTISKSNVDVNVPTQEVLKTASLEEIRAKRTVGINMYSDPNKTSWLSERKDDIFKIIKRYLPLGYVGELSVTIIYNDEYKNVLDSNDSWVIQNAYNDIFKEGYETLVEYLNSKDWKSADAIIQKYEDVGKKVNDNIRMDPSLITEEMSVKYKDINQRGQIFSLRGSSIVRDTQWGNVEYIDVITY